MNRKLRNLISVACIACFISLCGQLNAYAFYNPTFLLGASTLYGGLGSKGTSPYPSSVTPTLYGGLNTFGAGRTAQGNPPTLYGGLHTNPSFVGGMIRPYDFSGLSKGFWGTTILNPFPNSFSIGTYFPNETSFSPLLDRTYQANISDEVIRASNPVSDFRNLTWMFPGLSTNKYGLGNAFFNPLDVLTNPAMGYASQSPWANPFGMGYSLCSGPSACFNPFGIGFGMSFPPIPAMSPYHGSSLTPPVVWPPVNPALLPPPDRNSKYYVATTYEEAGQTIYVLLEDNGEVSQMELQDVLNSGIHCVEVKNLPGAQTSYSFKYGESKPTLALYKDCYSPGYIWAWK